MTTVDHDTLTDGPPDARDTFLFAHGAGAPMDSAFLARVAKGLAERGVRVVRFEFPYMARRRTEGRRGAPDREPVLLARWLEMVERLGGGPRVAVGGKSLGGRIASMIADEAHARGLVCFGYPFHPPGDREKLRTKHLETLMTPALILQGTRDPFGTRDDVAGYRLSPAIRVEWLEGGDHSFKPPAASGTTEAQHVARAIESAAEFIRGLPTPPA
ncbi:MAG TPA: alpha/beta fold hydrolase [Thermoanaerobaculia bacterium]|nr:alpha/beta fold hydrolase [Thermoanaerobaculia bacterium]